MSDFIQSFTLTLIACVIQQNSGREAVRPKSAGEGVWKMFEAAV